MAADTAARAALATEQLSGEVVAVLMEVRPPPISTPNPSISRSDCCASLLLAQVLTMVVSDVQGHLDIDANGVYKQDRPEGGWPLLKNAFGMYCYRDPPFEQW